MTGEIAEVTALLLARGFVEIYDLIANDGEPVRQDASLPASARRALTLLSALSLEAKTEDYGTSIHVIMDRACEPFHNWGLPQFAPPFRYADVGLVDRDLGVPTEDCREMARGAVTEASALEDIHHDRLRNIVQGYPARERNSAYAAIREFVVRNPAVSEERLHAFVVEGGHAPAARTIMSFYRPIPQTALFGRVARRCDHCGSLLWPDRQVGFTDGRCRIRQCRLAHPIPVVRDEIPPALWRVAANVLLAFWVGPGLDEIRIYDALRAAKRNVTLYPQADAADVGVDGFAVGIDVKTYASPIVLATRMTRSVGRLDLFDRRIVAFPDDKLRLNRRYGEQLRNAYLGDRSLEFMTVSGVIREFSL
jgi:hypothetical protein